MEGRKKKFIKELMEKPSLRRESGLYVVDGPKMCVEIPVELLEEVFVSEVLLSSAEQMERLSPLLSRKGYETVTEREMKQISDTVTPQGVLALVRQKRPRGIGDILGSIEKAGRTGLLILLEGVQDPGNAGTILRSAEAAGADAVICDRGCADVYSPKAVRSTMGAVFRLPVLRLEDIFPAVDRLKDTGYEILAAHLKAEEDYDRTDLTVPCCILIGNESRGLSDRLSDCATKLIRIPMEGRTESLNASVAASVIMFEAARQRRYK